MEIARFVDTWENEMPNGVARYSEKPLSDALGFRQVGDACIKINNKLACSEDFQNPIATLEVLRRYHITPDEYAFILTQSLFSRED